MAQRLTQYFLRPNTTPAAGTDPWRNNFLFAPNLAYDTFRNIATKVDQNVSDNRRCSSATPITSGPRSATPTASPSGPAQDGQLPLERVNHTGVADYVRTISIVARLQRPRRAEPVPRARALGPGSRLQPVRAGLPGVAGRPAAEPGVPAHQPHRLPAGLGAAAARRQRNHDRLQPAAELLVDEGHAQRARRSRHAADVVHARDQRQPLLHRLRPPLHAARVQLGRCAQRQLDRLVPARRRRPAARSTTTSIRRSAGTTTRRGSRTTGS